VVWWIHRHAWQVFLSCQTQWQAAPMTGHLLGIPHNIIELHIGRQSKRHSLSDKEQDQLWDDLLIMEIAAVNEANSQRDEQRQS
jgi:hypothetical protein